MSWWRLVLLSSVMAPCTAVGYVLLRGVFGQEQAYFLYAFAIVIGSVVGHLADPRKSIVAAALVATLTAVAAAVAGTTTIALLERAATSLESAGVPADSEETFIALEAYRLETGGKAADPPFTERATRAHYTDATWKKAEQAWRSKPAAERSAIREEWRANIDQLNGLMNEHVAHAFTASWNLSIYLKTGLIAGVFAALWCAERRQKLAERY
jgi:hypothetical protein